MNGMTRKIDQAVKQVVENLESEESMKEHYFDDSVPANSRTVCVRFRSTCGHRTVQLD